MGTTKASRIAFAVMLTTASLGGYLLQEKLIPAPYVALVVIVVGSIGHIMQSIWPNAPGVLPDTKGGAS